MSELRARRGGRVRSWPIALAVAALSARPAHGYEFWLRARSVGQVYQLRDYRLIGPELVLGRKRFSQTLALRIWDVGDLSLARRTARLPDRGLTISWQSYLRIDHDFGSYATGRVTLPGNVPVRRDALDVTPELAETVVALQLAYGYVELAGLVDGRLTAQVGRLLVDDGWGAAGVDGGAAQLVLPGLPLAVAATGGLAVRASSPLGSSAGELDGTAGAACQEYVEGATPGAGQWRLIDRSRAVVRRRLSSDDELCPQREVHQPTVAVSIATSGLRRFGAAAGYRRTWSSTVGLIGAVDRLDEPDRGLYPNEQGQAPGSGVNEERLWARVHGALSIAGLAVGPYADLRYSVLHAAIDRASAGVRLTRGADSVEPSVAYFLPTFDGDSIFNVFSIEPTTDVRLAYQRTGGLTLRAAGWLRRYHHAEGGASIAGGADAAASRALGRGLRLALDALWDDGYGGRRVGGGAELAWRAGPGLWLRARALGLGVARDDGHPRYVTGSTVASATWQVADGVALHTLLETTHDAARAVQYRALAMFDLAFLPEP